MGEMSVKLVLFRIMIERSLPMENLPEDKRRPFKIKLIDVLCGESKVDKQFAENLSAVFDRDPDAEFWMRLQAIQDRRNAPPKPPGSEGPN
jgi:hypothetical protein